MAEIEEGSRAARDAVIKALRSGSGRATVGDIVAATGLSRDVAEAELKRLLDTHKGHLEVSEEGELIYLFDPKIVRRDHRSGWERFQDGAARVGKQAFKIWIMLMLVVYFVVYVVMIVAAIAALQSQNRSSSSSSRSYGRGGGIPIHWLLYMFWTPDWHYGSHYYGHNSRIGRSREVKPPFYKRIFAFVFGPDEAVLSDEAKRRELIRLIQARRGVLTTTELIEFTGLPEPEADEKMSELLGALGGDVDISEEGELIYTFPEIMLSAEGKVTGSTPPQAWKRLDSPRDLTGNKKSWNATIFGFNAFNLVMSAFIAPAVLMPILGIGGLGATIGLVIVPAVFSVLFFAIPLIRKFKLAKENERRHEMNVRKLVLRSIFRAAFAGEALRVAQVRDEVNGALTGPEQGAVSAGEIERHLQSAVAEFHGDIDSDADGTLIYTFEHLPTAYQEAKKARERLRLEQQELGNIVFSTDDDELNFQQELKEFDEKIGYSEELIEEEDLVAA